MKIIIANGLSLSMLDRDSQQQKTSATCAGPRIPVPIGNPREWIANRQPAEIISAVGHKDTAEIFSNILGFTVTQNRTTVKLPPLTLDHETEILMLIGSYVGPRLPEGATTLPPGATIDWWCI